ncbi:cytochrome P450 [Aspergillus karnatakaensis]|uniref:cytochrome P450 n=1 Tax=Aspergillus karnatakaensis TaxID=1810916 RepID=UPI003CCE2482
MSQSGLLSFYVFAVLLAASSTYRYILHPILISPLSKIPNAHWTAPFCPIWILWIRLTYQELAVLPELHKRLGPLIRLGPTDLSVSEYENGIQKVLGSSEFEKHPQYSVYDHYGKQNSFSSLANSAHSKLRRRMTGIFSKSSLHQSGHLTALIDLTLQDELLPLLQRYAEQMATVDLLNLTYGLSLDFVTGFVFGRSSGSRLLSTERELLPEWLHHFENRYAKESVWLEEAPWLTTVLQKCGLSPLPGQYYTSKTWLESWLLTLCDRADGALPRLSGGEEVQPADVPVLYQTLRQSTKLDGSYNKEEEERLEIASELIDQVYGAREVLGLVTGYALYFISNSFHAQKRLRKELAENGISIKIAAEEATSSLTRELETLPYLSAVIQESYRLRPNSVRLPRVATAPDGVSIARFDTIPPGTRVNTFQWFVHRDPSIWTDVNQWIPERWLDSLTGAFISKPTPQQIVWPFGGGSRMCIGNNLADCCEYDLFISELAIGSTL